jgi:hypothetical protein
MGSLAPPLARVRDSISGTRAVGTDSGEVRFGRPFPILPAAKLLTSDADGNHVFTAAKTASIPLRVLLVGDHEEDFFLIREILERNRSLLAADLEHARSLEEAKELMRERAYGLVLLTVLDHKVVDLETNFLQKPYTLKQLSSRIRAALKTDGARRKSCSQAHSARPV